MYMGGQHPMYAVKNRAASFFSTSYESCPAREFDDAGYPRGPWRLFGDCPLGFDVLLPQERPWTSRSRLGENKRKISKYTARPRV